MQAHLLHHVDDLEHDYHSGLRSAQQSSNVGKSKQDVFIVNTENRCGTKDPSSTWLKESSRVMSKWLANKRLGLNEVSSIEVETYFHVISDIEGSNVLVSDAQLQQQLDVLNDSYSPHGFSFSLKGTTRTDNPIWYTASISSTEQSDMKKALRMGGASTLNVYFNKQESLLGYANLPEDYEDFPEEDGVVINEGSLPGGEITGYNEGKTLVHEVGHWLGLEHTFRLGCNTKGDEIDDTPRERIPTKGCPSRSKDSCPFRAGVDPIHNYMDYSSDVCLIEFTAGQEERMKALWTEYRASR